MRRLFFGVLAGLLLLAMPSARAADPSDELPPVEPLPSETEAAATGVYLRGSIGYGFEGSAGASQGHRDLRHETMTTGGTAGGGVGIALNEWFRTDVTADYRFSSTFKGQLACPTPCDGLGRRTFHDRATLDQATLLLNGYLDIPAGPVTPYVGAGLGAAYLSLHDYRVRSPGPPDVHGRVKGGTEWNAAYALMAGIGLEAAPNVVVDVGYRFASLGAVKTDGRQKIGDRHRVALDDVTAQEVMITLRYTLE